jgi:hypothetical protein
MNERHSPSKDRSWCQAHKTTRISFCAISDRTSQSHFHCQHQIEPAQSTQRCYLCVILDSISLFHRVTTAVDNTGWLDEPMFRLPHLRIQSSSSNSQLPQDVLSRPPHSVSFAVTLQLNLVLVIETHFLLLVKRHQCGNLHFPSCANSVCESRHEGRADIQNPRARLR